MKRCALLTFCICLFLGCGSPKPSPTAISIDNIRISQKEFNQAFESSIFSRVKEGGRKAFLDIFIARKLMLKEAEKMKLDKDENFLKDIQLFWEQSLLKRLLVKKAEEPAFQKISVDEKEIQDFYDLHKDKEFSGKTFEELKDQIKDLIVRQKQQQLAQQWAEQLRDKAKVTIDYSLLGISSDKQEK